MTVMVILFMPEMARGTQMTTGAIHFMSEMLRGMRVIHFMSECSGAPR